MIVDAPKLLEGIPHENVMPLDHERQITQTGAGIIVSTGNLLKIAQNPAISGATNQPTRKSFQQTSVAVRVNRTRRTKLSVIHH